MKNIWGPSVSLIPGAQVALQIICLFWILFKCMVWFIPSYIRLHKKTPHVVTVLWLDSDRCGDYPLTY